MAETLETTPLERAAKAVESQFSNEFAELLDPDGPLSAYGLSHNIVRAVLEAIRKPSKVMVEKGALRAADTPPMIEAGRQSALESWQAMIDAALEEE